MVFLNLSYPKITAFHLSKLFSNGAPLTPCGGSDCSLLKSRKSLRLAGVDMTSKKKIKKKERTPKGLFSDHQTTIQNI